jgi:hypothetical protein
MDLHVSAYSLHTSRTHANTLRGSRQVSYSPMSSYRESKLPSFCDITQCLLEPSNIIKQAVIAVGVHRTSFQFLGSCCKCAQFSKALVASRQSSFDVRTNRIKGLLILALQTLIHRPGSRATIVVSGWRCRVHGPIQKSSRPCHGIIPRA